MTSELWHLFLQGSLVVLAVSFAFFFITIWFFAMGAALEWVLRKLRLL
jgi:hypothetical protein